MLVFQSLGVYFAIGIAVGVAFAWRGAGGCVEPRADVSAGARLLLIPAAAIFWPLVLRRWLAGRP